jgi:hypothetical protein
MKEIVYFSVILFFVAVFDISRHSWFISTFLSALALRYQTLESLA